MPSGCATSMDGRTVVNPMNSVEPAPGIEPGSTDYKSLPRYAPMWLMGQPNRYNAALRKAAAEIALDAVLPVICARFAAASLAALAVTSCSSSPPPCEQNPAPYLKGTVHDCATRDTDSPSEGPQ